MANNPGIRLSDIASNPNITKQQDLFYTAISDVSGNYSGYKIDGLTLSRGLTSNCLSAEFIRYQGTYTTVSTNSGSWQSSYTSLLSNIQSLSSLLNANSGKWDSTYTTVSTNSANWSKAYTDLLSYNAIITSTNSNTQSLCNTIYAFNSRLIEKFGTPVQHDNGMVMCVTKDNRVIGWGESSYLHENSISDISPYPLAYIPFYDDDGSDYLRNNPAVSIVDLYYGGRSAMALLSDGTVWVNGETKFYGSISTTISANPYTYGFVKLSAGRFLGETPTKIYLNADTNTSLSGKCYSVITDANNLWVWGYNQRGQLGLGTTLSGYTLPTKVTSLSGVKKCVFGGSGNLVSGYAILNDGRLFVSGNNSRGQLGLGTTTSTNTWTQALTGAGTPIGGVFDVAYSTWGYSSNAFVIVLSGAAKTPTVWGVGNNHTGQLGAGNKYPVSGSTYFVPITSGSNFTPITGVSEVWFSGSLSGTGGMGTVVAKLSNNSGFYSWGLNTFSQCGTSPVSLPFYSNNPVLSTPTLFTITDGVSGIKSNVTISSLSSTNSYLRSNGILYAAGYNSVNSNFWYPNNSGSTGFYPVKSPITQADPIKDWININRTSSSHAGMLILTQYGRVYGVGVDSNNTLNGTSRGTAVLLT